MQERFLNYYNDELQYLRELGAEFSRGFPKIANRLGLDAFECADPYVERLLEGFAFLAARVRLKLDAQFPRFTQHLLELVYPHPLGPVPSMAVVQLEPDLTAGALAAGFPVPRGSTLRSVLGKGESTACEYRTAHTVTLWPIELVSARYIPYTADLPFRLPEAKSAKAALQLQLRATAGLTFDKLALDSLVLHLRGTDDVPFRILEELVGHSVAIAAIRGGSASGKPIVARSPGVRQMGFEEDESLLPFSARSFSGYRHLQEYFSFPQRFAFAEISGLQPLVRECADAQIQIYILLDRSDTTLETSIDVSRFALFCSPAINLFSRRCDRIHLTDQVNEHHVVPDRTRPVDFEIYQITGVTGYGTTSDEVRDFRPLYGMEDVSTAGGSGFYAVHRTPRVLPSAPRGRLSRWSYSGSEVYVSLVDSGEAPVQTGLKQLAVTALCTNRDLPLEMPIGMPKTDFTLESGAPYKAIRCIAGPTRPTPVLPEGEATWRFINHLSLNYLSLVDADKTQGAAALRDLLGVYAGERDSAVLKQVQGVRSVASAPIVRRMPGPGPLAFARGLEVSVTLDDGAFRGVGAYMLGAVLERFFAKYVSINSFTETVLRTVDRGEVMRWTPRLGQRAIG